jgi:hypothetical protein
MVKIDDHWQCGICNGQWWPPDKPERGEYEKHKIKYDVRSPESLIFGLAESTHGINYKPVDLGGAPQRKGSSRSGRKRKKKPKIKITNINYL